MLTVAFIAGCSGPSLAESTFYINNDDVTVRNAVSWVMACGAVDPMPGFHCEVQNGRPVLVPDVPRISGLEGPYHPDKCVLGVSYACSTHIRVPGGLTDPPNDIDLSEILGTASPATGGFGTEMTILN